MRVPYLVTSMNYFAEIYIGSALVGLVGTASMSDFPVVYDVVKELGGPFKGDLIILIGGYEQNVVGNIAFRLNARKQLWPSLLETRQVSRML